MSQLCVGESEGLARGVHKPDPGELYGSFVLLVLSSLFIDSFIKLHYVYHTDTLIKSDCTYRSLVNRLIVETVTTEKAFSNMQAINIAKKECSYHNQLLPSPILRDMYISSREYKMDIFLVF